MFKQKSKTPTFFKRASLVAILAVVIVASFVAAFSKDDKALAATSSTINFQARLLTAAGTIVPDGQYNVEFKLYDAATSGTNVWTETRTSSDKVRVVNGYLTVNLGSVTAFGSINWDQELWLTMNIGGTSVSPSWDGEMSPRLKLTAVPYAFTAGKLVGGSGANTTTLNTGTPSGTNTISLPAESGTLCIQNSANCGFALSSGGGNYIQNQFAGAQSTASFWISGTGRAATALQAPTIDTAAAGALGIGTTNATSINLNQDTTLASGKTLTLQGSFAMQPAANGTSAFNIKNQAGANLLTLDTTNSRLGFNLGGTTTPSYAGTAGFELKGGIRLSAGSAAYADDYITPGGGTVKSLINIVNYDPGAAGQLIAMGLPSTANSTARVFSALDARSSAHQPTIAVLSPNQNEIGGFSWDGSNSAFLVKNSSSSGQIGLNINGTNRLTATTTGVGINMTPSSSYALDVTGDVNISSGSVYRINGTTVCSATGCTPAAGSSNYIQNGTSAQTANFYIQSASASSVGAIIRGAASQTSSLLQLLDGTTGYTIAQFSNNGYLTLGTDSIAKAGQITLNDATASNTFSTTIVVPTALTASRTITLPDENGTICIQSSTTCGFAPTSGSTNYIQNQNAAQQASSNFWISGNGRADGILQAPTFDTPTAAALNIGTTNATGINLNKDTTITGALTQSGGIIDLTGNGASTIKTSSGALSIRAFNTNTLTLNTSGAGTVLVGTDNTTTISIGGGSDVARTINVGNPNSGTANQTVTVGTQHGTSVTTIQGGSSGTAVAITPASGGSVGITTAGAGAINLNSGSSISAAATTTGSLTAGGALTLTGGAASTWSTSAGALTITSAATATWSTSAGSLTVQAAGANALNLNTAGAGTVAVGDTNSTTINIGRGSDIARTISIGNAGSATAQAITIGSTGSTSTTTIQGGTGAGAIALAAGTNGSIGLTTAGTGDINLTSADAGQFTTATGALTLTGGAASTWSTSAGALTITSAAAATWSTSAGALTVQAAGTNALNLQTAGAGTVAVGDVNSTTVNIGRGSDIARAINIGTAGATTAQTIIMGSTGSTSTTTIQGGTGAGAIALTAGTNGSIAATTSGTGNIGFSSANAGSFTTTSGALTFTAGAASTWSTSAGNLTVQAATTNVLNLQTGGAGTVAVGDVNSTTINIGRGSDIARAINIGTAGATTAQTIIVGSTGSTSTTTIRGGTGAGAIALTAGTNGSIAATTSGTGNIGLSSANAGSFTTTAGALTLTGGAASTWSTSAGNLTVQAATTNSLILNTAGAGTVALGDTNSTTINIGRGSDIARTINIGTAGATTAQAITIGSTGSTSTTTINGGTGAGAIALAAGTNGSITMTTTGTGTNKISSATQTVIQSSVNSTTAFQIQNQANTPIFNVDTTNSRIDVAGVIQQTGMLTSDTAGTDATKWTKLGSCTITAQYGMCNTVVSIIGGNDGTDNDNTQATVTARVKQQNAMGGAPYVDVMLTGVARGIAKADIKGVTTVNTGATTTVELWGRINLTFEHWEYAPSINTNGAAAAGWVWTPVNGFSAALPGGTQTDATYGTTYADTLQVAPASNSTSTFSILDSTGVLNMMTVDTTNGRVIIGRDDGNNGADAKLYFGDVANVANPWIGEANGTDSDILQLQGKNGINFGVATTQTNVFTLSATGAVLFKNTADSTTAFQVQSQGTTPLFVIDSTTGAALNTLYATAAASGQTINITNASGTNTNGILVNRNAAGGTTTNGLNITNTAGTLTNGLAFTGTIGTDIFRSSGILTLSGAGGIATASNVSVGLVGTPGAVLHVSSGAASDLFKVTDSTATAMDVFKIANDGYATFQNRADSTTAFRVLKQAGNALFTVDTTSNLVNISGTAASQGGGKLTFGDNSYVYIAEYGGTDTDAMRIHGEEEIYMTTKFSATAMVYLDGGTGRVGINTEAPTEALTVVGNANVISSAGTKAYRWRTTGTSLDFEGGGADLYLSTWTNVGMTTSQKTHIVMQTAGTMTFPSIAAIGSTQGTLCINTTTKSVQYSTGTTCAVSSARYKKNIQTLSDSLGLDAVNAMHPVTYQYISGDDQRQKIGFIAEEMQNIVPQVVNYDDQGRPNGIDYEFLTANIVKAIQQQQVQINSLQQGLWNGGIVSNDTTFDSFVTFNKNVRFKGDAIFEAKVGFNGKLTYNPDTAGTIVMPHGKTSATVTFAQPYDQIPQISVSSSDYVSLKVTDKTVNGFTITLKYPFATDVNIDWVATQIAVPNQDGSNAPQVVVNEP